MKLGQTPFPVRSSCVVSTARSALSVLRLAASGCALMLLPLALAIPPVISNLAISQRLGEKVVEIDYDLAADASQVTVSLEISSDGGVKYSVPATSLSGDVGTGVQSGKGKTILWNAGADWNGNYSDKMRFRLKADDQLAATPLAVVGASDFFTVTKGRSVTRTVNLVNTGPNPAVVTALQLPAGFSASWSGTIPAGGAQSILVTFAPTSIGVFGGELRVVSPGVDHARHALRGIGSGPIRGIAFQDPASDLLGVLLPAAAADPALTLLRKTGGGKRLFFVFPDTTAVEMEMGAAGRLAHVTIGLHRFTFADYTATNVKLTYQRPDGVESTGRVSLAATAAFSLAPASLASFSVASTTPPPSEEQTIEKEVDDTLKFIADPSNTHLLLNIYRLAGEFIYDKVQKARETAQKLREDTEKLAVVAKNKIIVASEQAADAANLLAERAGLFIEELRQVDPQSETTAAIEVTNTDIQPLRNEWDQLLVKDKLDLEFTMTDLACEESVFAEMNPECPQYQPPVALAADNIAFTVYSDEVLSRTLKPSSAATSVRLVKEPATGLITDFNPTTGAFTYAPKASFVGEDRFTYVAANRLDTSPEATVVIMVKTQSCKNQINRDTHKTYYNRACTDSSDTLVSNNGKIGGYKRFERPPNGAKAFPINWNGFTLQFASDGEKVEYITAQKNDYDSTGRLFAEEERRWNHNVSGSDPYTIIKRTHTYDGTVKTTFTEIQESGGGSVLSIRTFKSVGLGIPTDNTKTWLERDEPLLTRESVEAFASSYMEKGDPTVAGMKQSIVYQLYTGDTTQ